MVFAAVVRLAVFAAAPAVDAFFTAAARPASASAALFAAAAFDAADVVAAFFTAAVLAAAVFAEAALVAAVFDAAVLVTAVFDAAGLVAAVFVAAALVAVVFAAVLLAVDVFAAPGPAFRGVGAPCSADGTEAGSLELVSSMRASSGSSGAVTRLRYQRPPTTPWVPTPRDIRNATPLCDSGRRVCNRSRKDNGTASPRRLPAAIGSIAEARRGVPSVNRQ
ncbi:hypothetical protein [Microbacterium sp. nov. GSS16]|uniref:hypothetical protein n=1 Tax=Microbacterium sp. nov. GSS16 TaxID=3019890 RepID=UPI0023055BB4|nr:hypothetical protein [Microbacterium sp. nov. GSS16]WCD91731.1 hypothetical protein PGB26_08505 [Microbacterium sp. nov. GSS16]